MRNATFLIFAGRLLLLAGWGAPLLPTAYAETIFISGKTRLPQLSNAEVTIWVGDQSTIAVAGADGRFSGEVEINSGPELVRVEACGVGDQDRNMFHPAR